MGCLNANQNFNHWFGNIHLSGPCNRACYFCIGQHMMALDALNNLDRWPLKNIARFLEKCRTRGIFEINVTGTNTDPLLYQHTPSLHEYLKTYIPDLVLGIRTNGVLVLRRQDLWKLYDKASFTICSFDPKIYRAMMGKGTVPNVPKILAASTHMRSLKVNTVLGPENVQTGDVFRTLDQCAALGISRVNLREPYGQPHVGDPLAQAGMTPSGFRLGMPHYLWQGVDVTYWDVHYVEVESVNLYANGRISEDYPISRGHDPKTGKVLPQSEFPGGRITEQWINY